MKQFYSTILLIALVVSSYISVDACTNFLITKGASTDGSTMITYAADAGGFMEPLFFRKAQDHKAGTKVKIYEWDTGKYLGDIDQAPHTYGVVGHINEHQVSIGETTFTGLKALQDTTGIIDYGSLIQLGLERSKTAREAIKVMTDLVAKYGYYSTGESFSVADPNEVWMLELIGKGGKEKGAVWVARRIPDGYVAAHANQARIRKVLLNDKENCMYSPDVITFAEKHGYYKKADGEFSFADVYCPLDPGGALYCEGRVWSFYTKAAPSAKLSDDYFRAVKGATPYPLFIKPDKKLTVRDVQSMMRDHFEGTPHDMTKGTAAGPFGCPYRWKNLSWKVKGDTVNKFGWNRPITTQQSAFTFVTQMRSWLPNSIGGIMWYGVDDSYTSCYTPLYCSMSEVPKSYKGGSIKEFDMQNAFWVFNLVSNRAYTKYSYIVKDVQKIQSAYEAKFEAFQPAIDKAALALHKVSPDLAQQYLNEYSISQAETVVQAWRDLWKYIVVKYNDGYINDVNVSNGRHPKGVGYDNDFLKKVLKERPGYYDVKWKKVK